MRRDALKEAEDVPQYYFAIPVVKKSIVSFYSLKKKRNCQFQNSKVRSFVFVFIFSMTDRQVCLF